MAQFNSYKPNLLAVEGGYVDHPDDPGGATNRGWTLDQYVQHGFDNDGDGDVDLDDLKLLTETQAAQLFKEQYWDKLYADEIDHQKVAETFVDHSINAGKPRAVKMMQYILNFYLNKNLAIDSIMGPNTLNAINSVNGKSLSDKYNALRRDYYNFRANHIDRVTPIHLSFIDNELWVAPSNSARSFIKGWLNRVEKFVAKNYTAIAFTFLLIGYGIYKGIEQINAV